MHVSPQPLRTISLCRMIPSRVTSVAIRGSAQLLDAALVAGGISKRRRRMPSSAVSSLTASMRHIGGVTPLRCHQLANFPSRPDNTFLPITRFGEDPTDGHHASLL